MKSDYHLSARSARPPVSDRGVAVGEVPQPAPVARRRFAAAEGVTSVMQPPALPMPCVPIDGAASWCEDEAVTKTYILTWNPAKWPWPERHFDRAVDHTSAGKVFKDEWSIGANKQNIAIGERAFLPDGRSGGYWQGCGDLWVCSQHGESLAARSTGGWHLGPRRAARV